MPAKTTPCPRIGDTPKPASPKVGDIVEVEFLDHVEDGAEPISFKVWGMLVVKGKKHFEILSWAYSDQKEVENPDNEKRWTIVRSAVTKVVILSPGPRHCD